MALYTTNNRRLNEIMHSSRGGSYAVGVVTIFVVLLMLLLAILPAYRSISDQIANNNAKSEYLTALNAKKEAMNSLQEQYNNNTAIIENFTEYTLNRNNNELITANLDAISKNFNVTLMSVSYDDISLPPKTAPMNGLTNLMTQPFSCQFKGNLSDLEALFTYLESYPVPFSFNTIALTHSSVGEKTPTLVESTAFELNISAFYYYWYSPQVSNTP